MDVWHCSSTDKRKCVKCGRMTGTFKIYEQTNIQIKLPLCDTDERRCYREIDIKDISNIAIKLIKREIRQKNNPRRQT
ncbi:hypothetical protein [Ornithinibacillus bavariensis]|uniref:hypothetical protein n=1 Tax=Ornithinibacillus bavariensis TaxID=545502 RepID=UPI000EBC0702|nr:hypothetical protein [Ornithinibacillus sp.]